MSNLKKDFKKILLAGILSIFLYAFVHELGHCIAVWFYGGRVTGFQSLLFWEAHMSYEGEGLWWKPLIPLAGSLLVALTAFGLLFTYRRDSQRTFWYYLKTIYILMCIVSLPSWIFMPLLFLGGYGDMSDDVHKFLLTSEVSPVAVLLAATVVWLLMIFLFLKKITAGILDEWRKKNIRRMGILLAGCQMLIIFILPFFLRLNVLVETGESFRLTEKDGSPDSPLKKQYEFEIKDSGTYVYDIYWGGECDGVITGMTVSLGDETVYYCTGEKVNVKFNPKELENGTYTCSLYCINSVEQWEEFFAMLGKEAPELEEGYSFRDDGRYVVYGRYKIVKEK